MINAAQANMTLEKTLGRSVTSVAIRKNYELAKFDIAKS